MHTVYEANNAIEAHMIANLLEQSRIHASVEGEYLQGGVGELQAMGLVRVMVNRDDIDAAKKIIAEWEASQPPPTETSAQSPRFSYIKPMLIGLAAGVSATLFFYLSATGKEQSRYNSEDLKDRRYHSTQANRDTDNDGYIDLILEYDHQGQLQSQQRDNNYDRRFDEKIQYHRGLITQHSKDTTWDGFNNYRTYYQKGIKTRVEFVHPETGEAIKIQFFRHGRLHSGEIDENGDGRLDTRYYYNHLEEPVRSETIIH